MGPKFSLDADEPCMCDPECKTFDEHESNRMDWVTGLIDQAKNKRKYG